MQPPPAPTEEGTATLEERIRCEPIHALHLYLFVVERRVEQLKTLLV